MRPRCSRVRAGDINCVLAKGAADEALPASPVKTHVDGTKWTAVLR
jgi:hypothetical protein